MGWPPDVLAATFLLVAVLAWAVTEWANGRPPRHAVAAMGRHLLLEAHRRYVQPGLEKARAKVGRLGDMLATRFRQQIDVIQATGRYIAVLCTRRAGKTELVPGRLFTTADKHPGTVLYYVAITGKRARELMWKPLLEANDRYQLGWKTNETRLTLTRADGTEIRLVGADKMRELEKRRGDKASIVIVDEAQSFPPVVLTALIDDVLGPALVDVRGTFVLLGTPGIICAGRWYEITRNEDDDSRSKREKRWDVYEWSALDNPHVSANVALEISERDENFGPDNPSTLREWRGRWVNDSSALFYAYNPKRNDYHVLPNVTWTHVMGVDLGTDDAFAYCVWAFSEESRELYEVDSFSESGLTPSQWVQHIKSAADKWNPVSIRVDTGGLGKAIVTEWQDRESLPIEAAEKANKPAYVKLLNDDLLESRIKVRPGSPLANEWIVLPKKQPERGKSPPLTPQEDERFPNHVADCALYSWREALHYLGRNPKPREDANSAEAQNAAARRRKEEAEDRAAREQEDDDWGGGGSWDE